VEGRGHGAVHDEQLLEVEERAAVRRALPYLHDGGPLVGVGLGVAEAVVDGELDDVGLLHGDAALQAVQEEGMDHGCGFGGAYYILND